MKFDRSLLHGMTGLLVLIVLGCASGGQHHRNLRSADEREMTVGTVQREISKGMDQASVAEALGSPNIVSKDKEGRETWIYDKIASEVSYSSSASSIGTGLLPTLIVGLGRASVSGASASTQKTLTVVIKFDDQQLVDTFSYHTSKF